jgi:hypothetical protein
MESCKIYSVGKIHRQLFRARLRRLRVARYELRGKNAFVSFFYRDSLRFYPVNPQPVTRNRFSLFFNGGLRVSSTILKIKIVKIFEIW